ncbi:phosphatase PAP2 family protein [Clostridium sp. C105KSO13]|uniref:phosphatase PAP2 family protein n=1 Tax=Clostridium sp. C105KSO13 TaxID=1776045 RepID=UPI000740899E|nr:phosphatase PAP2 family protein [Clostridium sp. C105KSO13]CUX23474.1 PAP2 superfamily protein [Clostridium sp. C105KSO13]
MSLKEKAAGLIKKYKHAWVFGYILIYMPWFMYLEKHVTSNYHVIHIAIDDKIPFVEYFIVPYLLWFIFIAAIFLYFFFTDVEGFYKLAKLMFTGMTIFLIISTLIPNGVNLRPSYFPRNNIFTNLVKALYLADTPTNVLPSLHVFNSISACIAIRDSEALQKHKFISWSAYALTVLIILATMFLKQHSVIDVMAGGLMAYTLYQFVYEANKKKVPKTARQEIASWGR